MPLADFSEQQRAIGLLQRSLERGRLGHAYLFTGDRLGELEAVARTLAQVLNCESPRRSPGGAALDCCGRCSPCRRIAGGSHPDVHWIRPESKLRQILVESTRELIGAVHLKPAEAQFKVAVITAADRMNEDAANIFLKTLEEPPARSVLLLLSTEPQRLLETVSSRCLRLSLAGDGSSPLDGESRAWLAEFSATAASEMPGLLARYRLLGTLLARLASMREEVEQAETARSPLARFDDVDPKLREQWEDELKAAIEAEYRRRRSEVMRALQGWLRDVWLARLGLAGEMAMFADLAGHTRTVGQRIAEPDATENLRAMEHVQRLLHTNVQEALALEVGLLKLRL